MGSRIRQMDLEGASPVKIIDREEIENSSAHTVGGILQSSPLSPYGGSTSRINVRGMNATRTLVLVNGKRLPKMGGSYGEHNRASNINAIPASSVERIKILSDGASAVYGSEALASVINIVTRKNLDGVSVSVKPMVGTLKGRDAINGSVTYGKNALGGYLSTSFDIDYASGGVAEDIDFYAPFALNHPIYSDNYTTLSGGQKAFPNCRERTGLVCTQYNGDLSGIGNTYKISNFTDYRRDMRGGLTLNADFLGRYREAHDYGISRMNFDLEADEVPNAWKSGLDYQDGEKLSFNHRLKGVKQENVERQYNLSGNIGVTGDWAEGEWMWSLNNNIGFYRESSLNKNRLLKDASKKVFQENRYNPFEGTGFSAVASEVLHDADRFADYFLNIVDFSVDGPVWEGEWGSLSLAAGAEIGYHYYQEESDSEAVNDNLVGLQGATTSGERTQQAFYTELGMNYSRWLESQLALRFDRYSDFGTTLNPKLAVKVSPWDQLAVRFSMGTGFKAPEIADSSANASIQAYQSFRDYVACENYKDGSDQVKFQKYCRPNYYKLNVKSNPDIQEETSRSYNLGVIVEPHRSVTVKVDYWDYKVEDVTMEPDVDRFLELQSQGMNPEAKQFGIDKIDREKTGDAEDIDEVHLLTVVNGGTEIKRGVDVGIDFSITSRHSLSLAYSRMLEDSLNGLTELGDFGNPRYRYQLRWDYTFPSSRYYVRLERETIGEYKTDDKASIIPKHSQYNASFRWNLLRGRGELVFKANNLFNLRPEYDRSQLVYFDTSLYSAQSSYIVQYKVTF